MEAAAVFYFVCKFKCALAEATSERKNEMKI